jgi:energy-coupling factor transporter ATP-binding protein EcfA2
MLRNFYIEGFRGFDRLNIEKLGEVNLIVGKNSVGKSSLLEALRIYASDASPEVLTEILAGRDEEISLRSPLTSGSLFLDEQRPVILRSNNSSVEILSETSEAQKGFFAEESERLNRSGLSLAVRSKAGPIQSIKIRPDLLPSRARRPRSVSDFENPWIERPVTDHESHVYVAANGLNKFRIDSFWDDVNLFGLEDPVITALRFINPKIDRVSFVSSRFSPERIPVVKMSDRSLPIPLRQLGDGIIRLFGIALALVSAREKLLLVDEIENGIHYSIQESLWRFIAHAAREFKVQVIATTHSLDCMRAFQHVTRQDNRIEGIAVRLDESRGHLRAVPFNEEELEIAMHSGFEVR